MSDGKSKADELLAAARARNQQAKEADDKNPKTPLDEQEKKPETVEAKIAAAEQMAETRVQAKAGTIDGTIDVEAMGDVKGDGRDAKDYPDTDPDKQLGVPVYEHGLHRTPADNTDLSTGVVGARNSTKRDAEIARGREIIERNQKARESAQNRRASQGESDATFRTTITDADDEVKKASRKTKARKK